jgi:hypothetical protein
MRRLALLRLKSHLDEDEIGGNILVEGKGHATIRVHRCRSEVLHIIVLAQNPLAKGRRRLSEGLDLGSGNLIVILELLANALAVCLKVFLDVLLAHGDLVQVKSNGFVNHIVYKFGCILDIGIAATEFATATNIDGSTRILIEKIPNEMECEFGHIVTNNDG